MLAALASPSQPLPPPAHGRGRLLATFTVNGPPARKKNDPVILVHGLPRKPDGKPMGFRDYLLSLKAMAEEGRRGAIIRSVAHVAANLQMRVGPSRGYEGARRYWLPQARVALRDSSMETAAQNLGTEHCPVMLGAVFYMGKGARADLGTLKAAMEDLLEEAGWLHNDHWVMGWAEETRRERDPLRPRTEIAIWRWEDISCRELF